MYNSQLTFDRIKSLAKTRNITMNTLQEKCGLSPNTIKVSSKGENGLRAKNLYTIADYLECSVDYLLGRTDVVEVNQTIHNQKNENLATEQSISLESMPVSDDITEMSEMIKKLPLVKRSEVILMIHKMLEAQ